jgi:hypothetical protein
MTSALLYIFTFTSWGLGLLSALVALSMKLQEHGQRIRSMSIENDADELEVKAKMEFMSKMTGGKIVQDVAIPDKLKELISNSPDHPEVSEIENKDEVFGVVFKAHAYPPTMDDDINDDDNDD